MSRSALKKQNVKVNKERSSLRVIFNTFLNKENLFKAKNIEKESLVKYALLPKN